MNTAGLEVLALALGGTLLVVAFVVIATAVVAELALLALAMMTMMIVVVASSIQPVALLLIREMVHLTRILFIQLHVHLAPHFCLNLFELMVFEASVVLTSLVDQLEVLAHYHGDTGLPQ